MAHRLFRTFATAVLVLTVTAAPALAVTIRDLLNLKAAGLSDDILIALIQTDGSIFHLTADDVIALNRQGLSERVILAMIDTARKAPPVVPAAEDPQAEVAAVEQESQAPVQVVHTETRVIEVPVEVPVAVPVAVPVVVRDRDHDRERSKPPEPVYWGYGGQRRPDSWPATPTNTPPSPPSPQRRGGS